MSDSIEAGDSYDAQLRVPGAPNVLPSGSQSPYGLWRSLGTRASGEAVREQLNQ